MGMNIERPDSCLDRLLHFADTHSLIRVYVGRSVGIFMLALLYILICKA